MAQKKRERMWQKKLFEEIIAENVLNLEKEIEIQIQETQISPKEKNPRSSTRHTVIIMAKNSDKKRISKAAREMKTIIYKENHIRSIVNFFSRNCSSEGSGMP